MKSRFYLNICMILLAVCSVFTSCSENSLPNSKFNGEWQSYHYDETDYIGCADDKLNVSIKGNVVRFDFGYDNSMCDPGVFTTTFDKETLQCEKIAVYINRERVEILPSLRFIDKEQNMLWVTFLSDDGWKSVYQCVRKIDQPDADRPLPGEAEHSPELVLEYPSDFSTTHTLLFYCPSNDIVSMTIPIFNESVESMREEGYTLPEIYQHCPITQKIQLPLGKFPSTPEGAEFNMTLAYYFIVFKDRFGGMTMVWFNTKGENDYWTNGTGGLKVIRR